METLRYHTHIKSASITHAHGDSASITHTHTRTHMETVRVSHTHTHEDRASITHPHTNGNSASIIPAVLASVAVNPLDIALLIFEARSILYLLLDGATEEALAKEIIKKSESFVGVFPLLFISSIVCSL